MGLLRRPLLLVKSWWGALTAPAQDPRRTFASAYERHRELLFNVRRGLTEIAASKNRLEAKNREVQGKLPHLEDQARRALISGREDLARLALQRRQVAIVELQTLDGQIREVQQEEEHLSVVEQRITTQIEAFYARQEIIAARYSTAEAQVRISEALTGVSEELDDVGLALRRAEEQTERMEARASAIDELVGTGALEVAGLPSSDVVAGQLLQLNVSQAVEDQLAALKRQLSEGKADS